LDQVYLIQEFMQVVEEVELKIQVDLQEQVVVEQEQVV
jgi:hypothetical protein